MMNRGERMKQTAILSISSLLLTGTLLLSSCSTNNENTASTMFEIPSVSTEVSSDPLTPIINEATILTVHLSEKVNVNNGMRIELRNNSTATRIYDATEVKSNEGLAYETQVIFEKAGENEVYLHFNVDNVHLMQKKVVEVMQE